MLYEDVDIEITKAKTKLAIPFTKMFVQLRK